MRKQRLSWATEASGVRSDGTALLGPDPSEHKCGHETLELDFVSSEMELKHLALDEASGMVPGGRLATSTSFCCWIHQGSSSWIAAAFSVPCMPFLLSCLTFLYFLLNSKSPHKSVTRGAVGFKASPLAAVSLLFPFWPRQPSLGLLPVLRSGFFYSKPFLCCHVNISCNYCSNPPLQVSLHFFLHDTRENYFLRYQFHISGITYTLDNREAVF